MLPFLLLACTDPVDPPGPLPWQLVGADGRTVLYRGVNLDAAAKRADLGYSLALDDDQLGLLPANGVTLARFLVFWEAVEPDDGRFDEAYLARVRADLQRLDALGVDVVVDLHQDVYGAGFGYTGFPRWTCDESHYAAFTPNGQSWFLDYTDPEVVACFDAFWADPELQDRYAAMAAHVMASLADLPNVVGMDALNEPFWGSSSAEQHDTVLLPAFYARLVPTVRAVAPAAQIWLEPSVANNLTADPHLDLSALDDPRIGFAPHFYPVYSEAGTGFDGDFTDEAGALDRLVGHAHDQGVPVLLGEFGIFSNGGNEPDYVRQVLANVEREGGSGALWSFDEGSGLLTAEGAAGPQLEALADPYPHRIPGQLVESHGAEVDLLLVGEGELEWVAPNASGCVVSAAGGEVLDVEEGGGRVRALLSADGPMTAILECGGAR